MFAAGGIIAGLIAIIVTLVLLTPQYESKSMLYILSKTTSVTSFADLQLSSGLTADFEVIATSMPVIDGAIEKIQEEDGITLTRKEIQEMISVSNTSDTRILVITAQDADPTRACIVANAVASETADQMAYIMKSDPPTTVEEAEVAVEPISPSVTKNTAVGILAGILLVGLYLVIQFIRNDNIKTQEDVEKYLGLSTLAVIPLEKGKPDKRKELKEMKKDHENNKYRILFGAFLIVFLAAAGFCVYYYATQKQKEQVYEELAEEVKATPEQTPSAEPAKTPEATEEPTPEPTPEVVIPIDFDKLQQRNADIYAWIQIPDTVVDYPILQSAEDNLYYLNHTVDGAEGLPGSIYTENLNRIDFYG